MEEKNPAEMADAELIGAIVGNYIVRGLMIRSLVRAVKAERPAKAVAMVWLLSTTPEHRARVKALHAELAERLRPPR